MKKWIVMFLVCAGTAFGGEEETPLAKGFRQLAQIHDAVKQIEFVREKWTASPELLSEIVQQYSTYKHKVAGKGGRPFEFRDVCFVLQMLDLNPTEETIRKLDKESNPVTRGRLLLLLYLNPERKSLRVLLENLADVTEANDSVVPIPGKPRRVCDAAEAVLSGVLEFRPAKPAIDREAQDDHIRNLKEYMDKNRKLVEEKFPEK